jgi:hypothetical protein
MEDRMSPTNTDDIARSTPAEPLDERRHRALERIMAALQGLDFGTVTAVVQDGVIVQVERTEKMRLDRRGGDTRP